MRMPDMVHALPWAALFFLAMTAIGHVSWRLIEEPPLRLRVPYFSDAESRGSRRGEARMNGLPNAGATQG
jgi:peptidoglycan/LPS O-acetylase OafA/YrhL